MVFISPKKRAKGNFIFFRRVNVTLIMVRVVTAELEGVNTQVPNQGVTLLTVTVMIV